jgi:anti-sigma regulatory factor (Ser/Thr protein kinase)
VVEVTKRRRIRLAPEVTAPGRAREFVAQTCAAWHDEQFSETGQLVVSELVTNAVMHSGTEIEVNVELECDGLLLRVHDDGDGVPAIVPPERRTIGGVGLELIAKVARRWGVTLDPRGGKDVWCELAAGAP